MKPHKLLSDSFLPVLLIVIVGAFFFSGMPISKEDLLLPTPTPLPGGGTNPTPTTAPANWDISFILNSCRSTPEGNAKQVTIASRGPANGYVSLDIVSGSDLINVATAEFIKPSRSYTTLIFPDGKTRRLAIFEGGSFSGEEWSGGTFRKGVPIPAVTCP